MHVIGITIMSIIIKNCKLQGCLVQRERVSAHSRGEGGGGLFIEGCILSRAAMTLTARQTCAGADDVSAP